MVVISNGSEPIFEDREAELWTVEHADEVATDETLEVSFEFGLAVTFPLLGGLPTDPDYCGSITAATGRKITVFATWGPQTQSATNRTYCIDHIANVGNPSSTMQVPVPDGLEGETGLHLWFATGDTFQNQFRASWDGGPESVVVTQTTVTEPANGGGNGDGVPGGDQWVEVSGDERVEVGDRVRVFHCVQAPQIPFNDLISQFITIPVGELTGAINNNIDCMETEVVDKQFIGETSVVVEGNECEALHMVELEVTSVDESCSDEELTYSALPAGIGLALSILIAGVGISLVLWRTESLLSGESGENFALSLPVLAIGGLVLLTGDDDE